MTRRYWILALLLIFAIFIIYFSKSMGNNKSSYESCIKMGGKIEYTDDSKYCELNGGIYISNEKIN